MKKRYDEIMEKILVTDEMRTRILHNIQNINIEESPKTVHFSGFGKLFLVAACFAILILGTIIIPRFINMQPTEPPPLVAPIPNPGKMHSAEELSKAVGFKVTDVGSLPFDISERSYTAYGDKWAEIKYSGEGQTAVFRKSIGLEDNSGDYNPYNSIVERSIHGQMVTLKGDNGNYSLAIWMDKEYSYSLRLSGGISEADWNGILSTSFN